MDSHDIAQLERRASEAEAQFERLSREAQALSAVLRGDTALIDIRPFPVDSSPLQDALLAASTTNGHLRRELEQLQHALYVEQQTATRRQTQQHMLQAEADIAALSEHLSSSGPSPRKVSPVRRTAPSAAHKFTFQQDSMASDAASGDDDTLLGRNADVEGSHPTATASLFVGMSEEERLNALLSGDVTLLEALERNHERDSHEDSDINATLLTNEASTSERNLEIASDQSDDEGFDEAAHPEALHRDPLPYQQSPRSRQRRRQVKFAVRLAETFEEAASRGRISPENVVSSNRHSGSGVDWSQHASLQDERDSPERSSPPLIIWAREDLAARDLRPPPEDDWLNDPLSHDEDDVDREAASWDGEQDRHEVEEVAACTEKDFQTEERATEADLTFDDYCEALALAVQDRDHVTVEDLLNKGIPPNVRTHNGTPILHLAVGADDLEMVRLLLLANADVDIPLHHCLWTPLHRAAARGNLDICKLLLQFGADASAQKSDGQTSADLARRNGHGDTEEFLMSHMSGSPVKMTMVLPLQIICGIVVRRQLGPQWRSHLDRLQCPEPIKRLLNFDQDYPRYVSPSLSSDASEEDEGDHEGPMPASPSGTDQTVHGPVPHEHLSLEPKPSKYQANDRGVSSWFKGIGLTGVLAACVLFGCGVAVVLWSRHRTSILR